MLRSSIRGYFSAVLMCFCLCLFSGRIAVAGQNGSQGTVNVTVLDSTNAVVSNADLELRDLQTNDVRQASTQDKGTYTFVNLSVGAYRLKVSKSGFETGVLDKIVVHAAQVTDVAVILKLGSATEVVEIHEDAGSLIETTSNAISTTIDIKQIEDLPLGGRDLTGLSYLVPGYTGAWSGLPSIAEGNNIDGIIGSSSRMKFTGNSQPFVSARLEDIQEMTVQTDQLDLGSGFGQANMQINFVTRRGTNSIHGRLYEDFRNTVLNANTWSNNAEGLPRDIIKLNDFGGSVGGAILKDKLFYFGSFAMSKQPGTLTASNLIMTPATQAGGFTYTDTNGVTQTVNVLSIANNYNTAHPGTNLPTTVNSVISSELQSINKAAGSGAVSSYADANLESLTWHQASPTTFYYPTVRVDYNLSQRFRLNFAWNETKESQPAVNAAFLPGSDFASQAAGNKSKAYTASLGFDWTISPTLVNQFRGGMLYNYTSYAYNANGAYYSAPSITWNYTGVPYPYGGNMSGAQFNLPVSTYYPLFNASDTVSWQHAAHTMSFGFSFYREQDHYWNPPAGITNFNLGLVTGDPALQAFTSSALPNASGTEVSEAEQLYAILAGRISSAGGQYPYDSKTGQYLHQVGAYNLDELSKAWGLFFQDSYRFRPNLTFNYGLRWDFTGDNHDLTSAYHGALPNDVFGPSGVGNLFNPGSFKGTGPFQLVASSHQYNAWNVSPQPAFGIAWSPGYKDGVLGKLTGAGKTVVRAGFSFRHFTEPYQYFWNNASDYGSFFYQNYYLNANNSGTAGTFAPGSLALGDTIPQAMYGLSPVAYEKAANESEFTFLNGVGVNGINPNIKQPYTESWNLGIQREVTKNTALEIRYIGSRSVHQWVSTNVNEVNIFAGLPGQPNFLQQFKNAQANLAINATHGLASFADNGFTGQQPTPIFDAAFAGDVANQYGNSQFITMLNQGAAGALAYQLTTIGGPNYFCNLVGSSFTPCANNAGYTGAGAGYPINFFQANPYQSGSQISYLDSGGYSNYNALQIDFRQKSWHGLQYDVNYAWSHTLGLSTANSWTGSINQFTDRNPRLTYGPTLYDLRHVVHANGTYDLPFGKTKQFIKQGGVVDKVVGGWTVGTIATFRSGTPFQLLGGYNTFNDYGDGGVVLNGVTVSQLQSAIGVYHTNGPFVNIINPKYLSGSGANPAFISPNTTPGTIGQIPWLYGPHYTNFDIAITKVTPITERFKLTFQSEFLNAFNHPNFGICTGCQAPNIQNSSWGTAGLFTAPGVSAARQIELRLNLEF
jgi:Carboxypeptidase regulatory-like domain